MNEPVEIPGPADADETWAPLASAVVYVIGITLGVLGCVGAFLWAPLLWCAMGGLVVIAVSFTINGRTAP